MRNDGAPCDWDRRVSVTYSSRKVLSSANCNLTRRDLKPEEGNGKEGRHCEWSNSKLDADEYVSDSMRSME